MLTKKKASTDEEEDYFYYGNDNDDYFLNKIKSYKKRAIDDNDDDSILVRLKSAFAEISAKESSTPNTVDSIFDDMIANMSAEHATISLSIGRTKKYDIAKTVIGYSVDINMLIFLDSDFEDTTSWGIYFKTYEPEFSIDHENEEIFQDTLSMPQHIYSSFKTRMNDVIKILEDQFEATIEDISDNAVHYMQPEGRQLWAF